MKRMILLASVLICVFAVGSEIDLSSLTDTYVAKDGDVLTGSTGHSVVIQSNATVVLRDVHITASASSPIACVGSANVLFSGENVLCINGGYSYAGLEVSGDSVLRLSNLPSESQASLCATGGVYSAGIGCSDFNDTWSASKGGTIIIDGGRIIAAGGGKGIGIGGGGADGKVVINDGEIFAEGIGGGYNVSGGTVEIYGGIVHSDYGTNPNATWGCAGIGGSNRGGGIVRIFGGVVYANGYGGSGVGDGDLVEIYGGNVEAHGDNGAGIKARKIVIATRANVISDSYSVTPEIVNINYAIWNICNRKDNAWNATDDNGIHYVFYYAFDKPTGDFSETPLVDIGFDSKGKVIIKTPAVVNAEGFEYSVVASDDVAGKENVETYLLDPSGTTIIPEARRTARFLRLKVEQTE